MTDTPPPDDLVERLLDEAPIENGQIVLSYDAPAEYKRLDAVLREAASEIARFRQKLEDAETAWERGRDLIAEQYRVAANGFALAQSQRDALQRFKDFVHRRLDEAGVPTHPDGPHSKEGCRIGDRLDIMGNAVEKAWHDARRAEEQRDALAKALDEYGMWSNPNMFEQAANEITCDGSCENTWRESDTNASGCYREERGEYCPFIVAETLRAVGKCALASALAQTQPQLKDTPK